MRGALRLRSSGLREAIRLQNARRLREKVQCKCVRIVLSLGWRTSHTACAVKEPVAGLDGIVDDIGTALVGDLPQTETDLGHLSPIVEGDDGRRHDC